MNTTSEHRQIHWPHTGIDAPYSFICAEVEEPDRDTTAHTVELRHSHFGTVGLIVDAGRDQETTFIPCDVSVFGDRGLDHILASSQQDGQQMHPGAEGRQRLLEAILYETEIGDHVHQMRLRNQFLVRSFRPAETPHYVAERGPVMIRAEIPASRDQRVQLASELACRLPAGAHWQMFDGERWLALTSPLSLAPELIADRVQHCRALARELSYPAAYYRARRFDDQFFLTGSPLGRFTLLGDELGTAHTSAWCTCKSRSIVAFEQWNTTTLEAAGTIHADPRCRRLVRLR